MADEPSKPHAQRQEISPTDALANEPAKPHAKRQENQNPGEPALANGPEEPNAKRKKVKLCADAIRNDH